MAILVNSGDNRIDALLTGDKWGNRTITYSFYAGGSYYGSEQDLATVSDALKNNVRQILNDVIAPLVNRNFVEVEDSPTYYGQIRFLLSSSPEYAYTYPPNGSAVGGDIFLSNQHDNNASTNGFQGGPGTSGYASIIHEILHALGTKHPNPYFVDDNPPYLTYSEDNGDNTLMTYNFHSGSFLVTPMPFDVMALQFLYGKTSYNSGDSIYDFTKIDLYSDGLKTVGNPNLNSKSTIWDSGGKDTLNFGNLLFDDGGYRLDMNPGGWLSKQVDFDSVGYDITLNSNLVNFSSGTTYRATMSGTRLAYEVTIENLINSSSNDYIIANSVANIFSGYGRTIVTGNDTIENTNNFDILDLSNFNSGDVNQTQYGNDLLIGLGSSNSVIIKNYFVTPSNQRINIKLASTTTPDGAGPPSPITTSNPKGLVTSTTLNVGDSLIPRGAGSQTNLVNNVSYNFPSNYNPTGARQTLQNTLGQTNAVFKNIFGLYQVDGPNGSVGGIEPGQPGYAKSALDKSRVFSNLTVRSGETGNSVSGDLIGVEGKIYAPFVIANGGNYSGSIQDSINEFLKVNGNNSAATAQNYTSLPVAYFSFGAANPDGVAHIKSFGNNVFGFEDLPSGVGVSDYDFNDMVFSFG